MTETTNKKLAKIIDMTNRIVINYYTLKKEIKPTPDNIHSAIYKKDKTVHSIDFELAINIMRDLGYIEFFMGEDSLGRTFIKELRTTNKGILLDFNGGLLEHIRREERKDLFYKWGQFAVIVAGVYYAIEILKFFCACL